MRALRNGIYHTIRRTHFERMDRVGNFVVIMLGTAVVASWVNPVWLGAATAVLGTLQLVWAPGMKARDHAVLQGKFFALVARAEAADGEDERLAVDLEQEMAKLYSEETTTMHAVNALAYNAAQNANGRPPETRLPITRWQRWMANFVAYSPDQFRPAERA